MNAGLGKMYTVARFSPPFLHLMSLQQAHLRGLWSQPLVGSMHAAFRIWRRLYMRQRL